MKKISFVIFLLIALTLIAPQIACAQREVELNCRSAILIAEDGQVLLEHESEQKRPVASMTKIMTLLLCYEALDSGKIQLNQEVCASSLAASMGGSQVFLDANSLYKVEDLIKSIIICSANDSCVAMAEHLCGSVQAFVNSMNKRAEQLGCSNTHFENCTGLPAVNHFSSAKDIAIMMRQLINHEHYLQCAGIWMEDFTHPSGRVTGMTNTNKLVRFYQGCDGGKTGYTSESGHCLCATAKRDNTRFISVVIGAADSKSRFKQSTDLLNYAFANYHNKCYASMGEVVGQVNVLGGKQDIVDVSLAQDLCWFGKKADNSNFTVQYQLLQRVNAPICKGDKLGVANLVSQDGQVVQSVDCIADKDVVAMSYWDYINKIITQN